MVAVMVPSSGIETWKSDSSSSRNASNSSSARSISSISSTGGLSRRIAASSGRSSRYFSEKIWSSISSAFRRRDGAWIDEQLALVVPLVERGRLVEPLVALQADQFGRVHRRQRLRHLGLADARLAFQQQRTPQQLHQRDRGRELAVGDVAGGGERLRDLFAIFMQFVIASDAKHPSACGDGLLRRSLPQ